MAVIQIRNDFGTAVCKALGIDASKVLGLQINIEPNELVTVSVLRSLDKAEANQLLMELEKYTLERKPEDPRAQAMETVARNLMKTHGGGSGG